MKQQVIFIHGGEAFSDYIVFLEHLKNESLNPYETKVNRWHQNLQESLGQEYEVFRPQMPNSENAKYLEWKIWFEKYFAYVHDGVVLIGHSQGGYFLSKYLTENKFPVAIKALYLVAAPIEPADFHGEDGGDFSFDITKLHELSSMTPHIVIFHSKDDFVLNYSHAIKYSQYIKGAKLVLFDDRVHFWQESFPEIIEDIRQLE